MYTQKAEACRVPYFRPETFCREPESHNSIFNYYSILNEIAFIKNIHHLPHKEKEFYVRENVLRFIGEFVGKVPYTQISYLNDGRTLTFGGLPIHDSYKKAAQLAGRDSREQFETDGFKTIHDFFTSEKYDGRKEENKIAWWISPSKIANYGFVFMFTDDYSLELGKPIVREYILRYSEPLGSVTKSNEVLSSIGVIPTDFHRPEEFLQKPLFKYSHELPEDVARTLNILGVDAQSIAQSSRFEQLARTKLAPWIDLYTRGIIQTAEELSQHNISATEQKVLLHIRETELKTLLTAIYNMAQEIETDNIMSQTPLPYQNGDQFIAAAITMYGRNKQAVVTGGGSCPVTKPTKDSDFISNNDIHRLLKEGYFIENIFNKNLSKDEKELFVCPKCNQKADGPVGNQCPHCGLTKEQAVKDGYSTC